jgi:hypothetical protein
MAILQSLTVNDTGNLTLPNGTSANRPSITTNIVQWTNTGTQAVSVLSGSATTTTTSWTCPAGVTRIEVLVVAGGGGGGGGNNAGGAGGAGGLVYTSAFSVVPTTVYTVTAGAGGTGGTVNTGNATAGNNSSFSTLIATGGGQGGFASAANTPGYAGGSGGGGGAYTTGTPSGGNGVNGQGFNGGAGFATASNQCGGGGGGGAGGPAANSTQTQAGAGGIGLQFSISGTPTYYAGGGGGGAYQPNGSIAVGIGGLGGGGTGGLSSAATAGTASTGGGGGGAGYPSTTGGNGGSGVIIIRYSVASSTQPIGQLRYNTDINTNESFSTANQWSNITNNTVLYLDTGNSASYPGSGSTWTDLSGTANNVTLTASPTFGGSGTGGYLTFNGSSQYGTTANFIDLTNPRFAQGYTIEVWCYPTSASTKQIPISFGGGTSGSQWQSYVWFDTTANFGTAHRFVRPQSQNNVQDQNDFVNSFPAPINNWYQVVMSNNYSTSTVYVNGANGVSNFSGVPSNSVATAGATQYTRIGYFTGYNYFTGRISIVKVYNKALTADEVAQSFNIFKGRYGL